MRTEAVSEELHTEYEGDEAHGDTDIEVPSADQAIAERLGARFPDGLRGASAWDGVGARGGALELGLANRAINAQEMVSGANAIVSAVEALTPRGIRSVDAPFLEPKIKNLAIGAHGLRGGLPGTGLGPRNARQSDNPDESGNNCTRIRAEDPPESCDEASEVDPTSEDDYDWNVNPAIPDNIQPFVDGLRGYVTDDVAIHLLACNAAASPREEAPTGHRRPDATPGTEEDTTWGSYYAGAEPHGERSFAGLTQESLVDAGLEDASVSGHTQAGHGTRNLTVRFFGGDVAEGQAVSTGSGTSSTVASSRPKWNACRRVQAMANARASRRRRCARRWSISTSRSATRRTRRPTRSSWRATSR